MESKEQELEESGIVNFLKKALAEGLELNFKVGEYGFLDDLRQSLIITASTGSGLAKKTVRVVSAPLDPDKITSHDIFWNIFELQARTDRGKYELFAAPAQPEPEKPAASPNPVPDWLKARVGDIVPGNTFNAPPEFSEWHLPVFEEISLMPGLSIPDSGSIFQPGYTKWIFERRSGVGTYYWQRVK